MYTGENSRRKIKWNCELYHNRYLFRCYGEDNTSKCILFALFFSVDDKNMRGPFPGQENFEA